MFFNSSNRIGVEMCGRYADQTQEYMNNHKEGSVVLLFQLCRIKEFNGSMTLCNSFYSTCILINVDLPEFRSFVKSLDPKSLESSASNQLFSLTSNFLTDDYFVNTPFDNCASNV